MGTVWFGAAAFAVVLVLLLIFILQNSRTVQISGSAAPPAFTAGLRPAG